MGGESSMANVESGLEVSTGSENELVRIRGAQLCLIDGKESVILQSGDFALHVIKQNQSSLAAVVGLVGDLQWPVGRDSPVVMVGSKKYAFALPGLLYGLLLPSNTPVEAEQNLEGLLQYYSAFETHLEVSDGETGWLLQVKQEATDYWTTVAPQVEKISSKMAQKISAACSSATSPPTWTSPEAWCMGSAANSTGGVTDEDENTTPPPATAGNNNTDTAVSQRMLNRIQRARRMSAVAKLLSKTLLRGAINAERHVVGQPTGTSLSVPIPAAISPPPADITLASVDAFTKVVEAVETAGRSLFELADFKSHNNNNKVEQLNSCSSPQFASFPDNLWTLNKCGLRLLLRATAVSAVIHVARGIGVSGFAPAQSSPQSVLSEQPSDTPSEDVHSKETYALGLNFMSADSLCSPAPSTRVPHGPNSPFQQYSKPADTQFHFPLGFNTNNAAHQ
ncbi:protein EARLY-RESPONSIVE TO DEHYDRATION 7, chloroplastic isoform X1 [Cryptomeria japonica]|uniref:protein EARLY-RESPONSIVE TO DEHYDRATION 7, chloroplastic isoform X1 n=1 Tax=Cryptomeria japonica TaxID=3369 RepID=UPI0027DA85F5|nr:protein EARLY-RESPONSIVE TO DEHYDRATION 7, chloroplastic isoform X1 [Cryptomeria japonica]